MTLKRAKEYDIRIGMCFSREATWKNCVTVRLYSIITDAGCQIYITEHDVAKLVSAGYLPDDETNVIIEETDWEPRVSRYTTLCRTRKMFLPSSTLTIMGECLIVGNAATYSEFQRLLLLAGLSNEEAINQIRFSLLFNFIGFSELYCELGNTDDFTPLEHNEAIRVISEYGSTILTSTIREPLPEPLFASYEEACLGIIFSVHMNAKEFTQENYEQATKKRIQAFYNSAGAAYHENVPRRFLSVIFARETIKYYHDYIPKLVRNQIYRAFRTSNQPRVKPLFGTLMEFNGMSLIRETYKLIIEGPSRRFMTMTRYVSEITSFMQWYNSNRTDETFKYYWYTNPNALDAVAQSKFVNLYSLVLKQLRSEGAMSLYRTTILKEDSIPLEDLQVTTSLISEAGSVGLSAEYYALIRRRPVEQPAGLQYYPQPMLQRAPQ